MRSRTATALVGLVASLAISVLAWWYLDTFLFFLLIPFVPFLFHQRTQPELRECPVCPFQTTNEEYDYCPRDGHRLE